MMTGVLLTAQGERLELTQWLRLRLRRTGSVPCDSFEGECLWEGDREPLLERADRLILEENGERRFTGILDEYELRWGEEGSSLTLSARGLAALLLDNEAVGRDYQLATLEDVIRNHVTPYGMETGRLDRLPPVAGFTVPGGASEWQVLDSFARYHGGADPRFDVYGRLSVERNPERRTLRVDEKTGFLELVWRDRRCRVCSEILMRDRGSDRIRRISDPDALREGIRRRRVLTLPRKSGYQAMRYSGEFQLTEAKKQRLRLELTLPGSSGARPGDRLELSVYRPAVSGTWTVLETLYVLDGRGARTKLTLG